MVRELVLEALHTVSIGHAHGDVVLEVEQRTVAEASAVELVLEERHEREAAVLHGELRVVGLVCSRLEAGLVDDVLEAVFVVEVRGRGISEDERNDSVIRENTAGQGLRVRCFLGRSHVLFVLALVLGQGGSDRRAVKPLLLGRLGARTLLRAHDLVHKRVHLRHGQVKPGWFSLVVRSQFARLVVHLSG